MDWKWHELATSRGVAVDVPSLLDLLLKGNREERAKSFSALAVGIVNQGDLYSASAAVADLLVGELRKEMTLPEDAWLLLHEIFRGSSYGQRILVDGLDFDLESYCRSRVLENVDLISESVKSLSGESFRYATLLLGSMGEFTRKVISILEREVAASRGERLRVARDALEVAVELADEAGLDGGP